MDKAKELSQRIIALIHEGKIMSRQQLNKRKNALCKQLGLKEIPSNADILAFADKDDKKAWRLLLKKPVRSLSGIAVVAVMPPPRKCPGQCIYCPSSLVDVKVPKSYTGEEPATRRAVSADFDGAKQVGDRLQQLKEAGHNTSKIDLIVMGGTFPAAPLKEQEKFMLDCFNAFNVSRKRSLAAALTAAEKAERRVIGVCFETRPDYCRPKHIRHMLDMGGTRVELGVQTIDDNVYRKVRRGHTVEDVVKATAWLKDSAFKVAYHLMPGLPFTDAKKELKQYQSLFKDQRFKPDMLKIYPCLVIEGTKLYEMWQKGDYTPFDEKKAVKLISRLKAGLPPWVRVMRIQRDIPANLISAGVKASNLRQLVEEEMRKKGWQCNCIRCREAGLQAYKGKALPEPSKARLCREDYEASQGQEVFLSAEEKKKGLLYAFCRLRLPHQPFHPVIDERTALIRELHVYSPVVAVGEKALAGEFQHQGWGRKLLAEAEKIAAEEFDCRKITVISGVGARQYYQSLGYSRELPFVSKKLEKT